MMSTALNGLLVFLVLFLFWRINNYEKTLLLQGEQIKSLIRDLSDVRDQVSVYQQDRNSFAGTDQSDTSKTSEK